MTRGVMLWAAMVLAAGAAGAQVKPPNPQMRCLINLKQIGTALMMFAQEHDGKLPKAADYKALNQQLERYIRNPSRSTCPVTGKPYLFNTSLAGAALKSIKKPVEVPVVRDAAPHPDGSIAFVYADGHSNRLPAAPAKSAIAAGVWK